MCKYKRIVLKRETRTPEKRAACPDRKIILDNPRPIWQTGVIWDACHEQKTCIDDHPLGHTVTG